MTPQWDFTTMTYLEEESVERALFMKIGRYSQSNNRTWK
jgi:hypothetical protein